MDYEQIINEISKKYELNQSQKSEIIKSIDYVKENYGEEYLIPVILVHGVDILKEQLPALDSFGLLPAVPDNHFLLNTEIGILKNRKKVLSMLDEPLVYLDKNNKYRVNKVFRYNNKEYTKFLKENDICFKRSNQEKAEIIKLCKKYINPVANEIFWNSINDIEKLLTLCKLYNYDNITEEILLKKSYAVRNFIAVCANLEIILSPKMFKRTSHEIQDIVEFCKKNNLDPNDENIYNKPLYMVKRSFKYIKDNYPKDYLLPSIIGNDNRHIREIFPYLSKLGYLEYIKKDPEILSLSLQNLKERIEICQKANEDIITTIDGELRFNRILTVSTSKYYKIKDEINGKKIQSSREFTEEEQEKKEKLCQLYDVQPSQIIMKYDLKHLESRLPLLESIGLLPALETNPILLSLKTPELFKRKQVISIIDELAIYYDKEKSTYQINDIFKFTQKKYKQFLKENNIIINQTQEVKEELKELCKDIKNLNIDNMHTTIDEVKKVVKICSENNIEINPYIVEKKPYSVMNILKTCYELSITPKRNMFKRTSLEIVDIVRICKEYDLDPNDEVLYNQSPINLEYNIKLVLKKYGKTYLLPHIVSTDRKRLKELLEFLNKKNYLNLIITNPEVLKLGVSELMERFYVSEKMSVDIIILDDTNTLRFNDIINSDRKTFSKYRNKVSTFPKRIK